METFNQETKSPRDENHQCENCNFSDAHEKAHTLPNILLRSRNFDYPKDGVKVPTGKDMLDHDSENTDTRLSTSKSKQCNMNIIHDILKFPVFVLSCVGFCVPLELLNQGSVSKKVRVWKQVYATSVLFINAVNVMRYLAIYLYDGTNLLDDEYLWTYVQTTSYTVYTIIKYSIETYVVRRHFPRVALALEKYDKDQGFRSSLRRLHLLSFYVTVTCNIYLFIYEVAVMSCFLFLFPGRSYFIPFQDSSWQGIVAVTYFFLPFNMFPTIGEVNLLIFYSLVIHVITAEFNMTATEMTKALNQDWPDVDTMKESCNRVRERHRSLCEVTTATSLLCRNYLALSLLSLMTFICLMLYGMTAGHVNLGVGVIRLLAVLAMLGQLVFMPCHWGRLCTAANGICNSVSATNWTKQPDALVHWLQLLLTDRSLQKTGIDLYGLFTFDTSSLIMILGTVLTYGVVVVQFQLSGTSSQSCPVMNLTSQQPHV